MSDFSSTAKEVWKRAAFEAALGGSSEIHPSHLLAAIVDFPRSFREGLAEIDHKEASALARAIQASGASEEALKESARSHAPSSGEPVNVGILHRSAECKRVFDEAEALASGQTVSALHLLSALLTDPTPLVRAAISAAGADLNRFLGGIAFPEYRTDPSRTGSGRDHDSIASARPGKKSGAHNDKQGLRRSAQPEIDAGTPVDLLQRFGKDLTELARQGEIAPIVGRRNEILQTIQSLARKKKNNPVLVGDPGVGKTAIVEALALRAVQNKDRHVLDNVRIIELNMATLMSGTKLRGQFEERMTGIIKEASLDKGLILFIDEIHTVMAAGNAADLLKPAMARGAIRLIGATTTDEYRRFIEKDPALDRRFERVLVDEPTRADTIAMMAGIKESLESHHDVVFDTKAIEAAVDLSMRFDVDHRLPDKAIDLLDRAGAQVVVSELSMNPLEGSVTETIPSVYAADIARVLANKLGMPPEIVSGALNRSGADRLLQLEATLRRMIRGQDEAVERVAERMILAHAPVLERRGPMAVMLFLGPSGVGKTELARQLASFLFGSEKNLIRLDMSEYKGEHTVSKLIGAPPGYVGSDEEGQLTRQIRTKPYSVVLLDEVEKAHERVYDVFLQVFDEGRITDSKGRLVDARNCIFILTSNVRPNVADGDDRTALVEALKSFFRPELINRIGEIVSFRHLPRESIREILISILEGINRHIGSSYGTSIEIGDEALDLLTDAGYNPEFGARELRRTVERKVQIPLSKRAIAGDLDRHAVWKLMVNGDDIVLQPKD